MGGHKIFCSFRSQNLSPHFQNRGAAPARSLPGLRPWIPRGNFRPPDLLAPPCADREHLDLPLFLSTPSNKNPTYHNVTHQSARTTRRPLFLVIPSRSIYLCTFIRRFSPLQTVGRTPGVAYLQTAYGQTAGVLDIFPGALCGCH